MIRPKIGLDWDDVTADFNQIAVDMANETGRYQPPLTLDEIDSWEMSGRIREIKQFYSDPLLYKRQKVSQENKEAVKKLREIADVYFITAVAPEFMGTRAMQILEEFPDFPPQNIILGTAKYLVQLDIVLDDAIHNIMDSIADYPVLMRRPWNKKMTGLLSVNSMEEFVSMVMHIIESSRHKEERITEPSVLALVGPSGSGKNKIAHLLCEDERVTNPKTYSTKQSCKHHYLTDEEFEKQEFFERTMYAGVKYGTKKEDIEAVIHSGKHAVMPLDMCGAIAMKRHFPTKIIFVNRDKEKIIQSILEDSYSIEEKTLRILSIDAEKRNRQICDFVFSGTCEEVAEQIQSLY